MTIYYVELEKYESRYTLQLTDWNVSEFKRLGITYYVVEGDYLDTSRVINTGEVLDAHGRCYFALSQMRHLVQLLHDGKIRDEDVIFFEDMFHPGLEALPYILSRANVSPQVVLRCLAQTVDPDDFIHRTGMARWMRHYEHMVDEFATTILCHSEEMVANLRIAGWKSNVVVTGCPFSMKEVRSRAPWQTPWSARKDRVVFASRFDDEKQPLFFLELAKTFADPEVEFVFASGMPSLRSNNSAIASAMFAAQKEGIVRIRLGLKKDEYYNLLATSKVLFNCALQDWVSNTACEADALGCNLVYPAYRSFPETFGFDHTRLYVPWSLWDAKAKVMEALTRPSRQQSLIAAYQDQSIHRTLFALGLTDQLPTTRLPYLHEENDPEYRKLIAVNKLEAE